MTLTKCVRELLTSHMQLQVFFCNFSYLLHSSITLHPKININALKVNS